MSSRLCWFRSGDTVSALALPILPNDVIADWDSLRKTMLRKRPPDFERDEWAYLVTFLDREHLESVFHSEFGDLIQTPGMGAFRLLRPRGLVGIWLPNNVSLLGPLALIILTLTGCQLWLKSGSEATNLARIFLDFAREHLRAGPLKHYLETMVAVETLDRDDARLKEMAVRCNVRIVFGSDAAAEAIHGLASPHRGVAFSFLDRQSEAWLDLRAFDEGVMETLAKVFVIYGQAGCTSPRRVVVINGTIADATEIRRRLLEAWPRLFPKASPMHFASTSVMTRQWAAAAGWDAALTPGHNAVLTVGPYDLAPIPSPLMLSFSPATLAKAVSGLPSNIQTVGYAAPHAIMMDEWLPALSATAAKRLVPIGQMHHFGPVWDGQPYWRQCFEEMEVAG
jgi:hypothetical protein